MQTHVWRTLAAATLALGALTASGCGSSKDKTVDDQQVEQGITDSLSTSSLKVEKVSCPSNVPVQKGDTFDCSVTFTDGATATATVTQKGGGQYTYALKPGTLKIPGTTVAAEVEKDLAAQGAPNATVTCPGTITVKVGTTVTCDVSSASGAATGTVTFTFSSNDGTVDQSSVKTS